MRITVASTVVLLLASLPVARALSGNEVTSLDSAAMAQLEDRAQHAEMREQVYLYTELIQVYTQVAGRQIAAGELEQANATMTRIQSFAGHLHAALAKNTKKLKDAEMMLHMASYHLGQYMRTLSSDDKPEVESTLKQLEKVHEELLAQVFAR